MWYPPVLQLGTIRIRTASEPAPSGRHERFALAARRCQELERQPAHGVQSPPVGAGRSKAMRAYPVAAAGIVVAVVIVSVVAASGGAL